MQSVAPSRNRRIVRPGRERKRKGRPRCAAHRPMDGPTQVPDAANARQDRTNPEQDAMMRKAIWDEAADVREGEIRFSEQLWDALRRRESTALPYTRNRWPCF